jgi:hypothetical protein
MAVSKEDREEYEQGIHDSHRGFFDTAVSDITGDHPDSEAYYKGRRGEQLDDDKSED